MNRKGNNIFWIVLILCASYIFITASVVNGATYYVDYEDGSDSSNGLSNLSAFKHCPGDSEAKGNAAVVALVPGDTILFRGGVKYRGIIDLRWSGSATKGPITYKGDGWGSEMAIVTGAEAMDATWTKCASQSDCWGNPNWSSIYYTTLPAGMTIFNRLLQNDKFLWFSQGPNPSDPLFWNTLSEWYKIPKGSGTKSITNLQCTDPDHFSQADSSYWDEAYVAAWTQGNVTEIAPITGFNPALKRISYNLSKSPYTDRDNYYSVLNHPALIDSPSEYAVSNREGRLYLWPSDSLTPKTGAIERSLRSVAFYGGGSFITIEGFKVTGTSGDPKNWNGGGGVNLSSSDNIVVNNCEFVYLSSMSAMAAVRSGSGNISVINNSLHDLFLNRGIAVLGKNVNSKISNNKIYRIGYTGILLMGGSKTQISGNEISEVISVHGNGISVYGGSSNVVVEKNKISRSPSLFTFEQSSNLKVINNIFDGSGIGTINEWGGMSGYIHFINNTMVNKRSSYSGGILNFSSNTAPTRVVINNVIDGGGATVIGNSKNNIFMGLAWNQGAKYGWSLSKGESIISDLSKLFVSPDTLDYRPLSDSPLLDGGVDVSAYGVTDDILGNKRPQGKGWSIGAYELPGPALNSPSGIRIIQ